MNEETGRINVKDRRSLAHWARRLGVTNAELLAAVRAVGNQVPEVTIELSRTRSQAKQASAADGMAARRPS